MYLATDVGTSLSQLSPRTTRSRISVAEYVSRSKNGKGSTRNPASLKRREVMGSLEKTISNRGVCETR